MKIAVAQINTTVGDIKGNVEKIITSIKEGKEKGVDLLIFPELTITGYPPKDLLVKKSFIKKNEEELETIKEACEGISAIVGFAQEKEGNLYNAAAIIKDKKIVDIHHKFYLPNYDVFDEKRYFSSGKNPTVVELEEKIGITICEDIWESEDLVKKQCEKGAKLIINI